MSHGGNTDYSAFSSPQITSILQQRLQNADQMPTYPSQGSPRAPQQTPSSAMYNPSPMGPPAGMMNMPVHSYQGAPAQSMPAYPQSQPQQMYFSSQPPQNMQYSSAPVSPKYAPQMEIQGQGAQHSFPMQQQQQQLSSGSMSPSRTPTSSVPLQPLAVSPVPAEKTERAKSPGASSVSLEPTVPLKPPKAPEKPLIPYLRFSKSVWETAKSEHPGLAFADIGKVIGEKWKAVDPDVKQKFTEEYIRDKEKYAQAQKLYLESHEYQEWLAAKTKREQLEDEAAKRREELAKAAAAASATATANAASRPQSSHSGTHSGGLMQPLHGPLEELQSMSQRMLPPKQPGGVSGGGQVQAVQMPADVDEDSDDYLKSKHVSATRYKRNHKLMAEVFSDSIVPDGRMVVNEQRMALLRKQVQSLTHHQERLLSEQKELNDKHEAKKRKLLEDTEAFNQRWAQVKEECRPVSKEPYQGMLDKYQKMLEKLYADHHAQTQKALQQEQAEYSGPAAVPEPYQPAENQAFGENPPTHIDNIMPEPISSPPPQPAEMPSFQDEQRPLDTVENMEGVQESPYETPVMPVEQPVTPTRHDAYVPADEPKGTEVIASTESSTETMQPPPGTPPSRFPVEPISEPAAQVAVQQSFTMETSTFVTEAPASPPKTRSPVESPKNSGGDAIDVARMPLKKRHSLTPYGDGLPSPSPPAPKRTSPIEPATDNPAQEAGVEESVVKESSLTTTTSVRLLEPEASQQEVNQQQVQFRSDSPPDNAPPKPMGPVRWFLPSAEKDRRPELDNLSDVSSDEEAPERTQTEVAPPVQQQSEELKPDSAAAEKNGGNYADYPL